VIEPQAAVPTVLELERGIAQSVRYSNLLDDLERLLRGQK